MHEEHWCCKQKTNALVDHCSSVYFLAKWVFWINKSSGNINNNKHVCNMSFFKCCDYLVTIIPSLSILFSCPVDVLWCPLNDKQRSWEGRPDHDTSLENGLQFVYPGGISLTNLNTVNLQTLFQHVWGWGGGMAKRKCQEALQNIIV